MQTSTFDAVKRCIDIGVSAAALFATAPLQLATACAVRLRMGTPVLFKQQRPGRDGRLFTLVKFRTMRNLDHSSDPRSDADRLTRLGKFLRATSADELPTLWNVLRGDMSLVGPRPLLPEYLDLYTEREARRHEVRPGMTGLAQVAGRNLLTWDDRLALDVEYVEKRSLSLDVAILFRTVRIVVTGTGVSHDGHVTMSRLDEEGGGRLRGGGPSDGR